jgi:hypothetical protein
MPCTQQELDGARAEGIKAALRAIDLELRDAQNEVDLSNRPNSTFSGGNRDRAILRLNVLKKVRTIVAEL